LDTLRIYLLGPFEVYCKGKMLTDRQWRSQQSRAILKILVVHHGRVVTSDKLIETLWPGEHPETARSHLHVRISQLRRNLDADDVSAYIRTVEGGYTFKPKIDDWWLDIREFESLAQTGRLSQENGDSNEAITAYEAARSLYRGDLLEEDLYEDWIFAEREQLRERFLTLLTELSECYAQQGRYRRAIARCHQVLAIDPCREVTYVRLMLYHYYAGERTQSLRVFQQCRQILADELDVEPLPGTVTLSEQIHSGTLWAIEGTPRYPPPIYEGRLFEVPYSLSNAPFVGREREYAWLVDQWKDKQKKVILIEGEAGVGKSRLVEEFLGYAVSQGATVLQARISPGEQLPYAPVLSALQPLMERDEIAVLSLETLAALTPLFPGLRNRFTNLPAPTKLSAEQEKRRFFEAIDTLVKACLPDGTLLVLDDAHRASAASCELLAYLASTLKIVLVFRREEVPADHPLRTACQALRRAGQVAALSLELLPAVAVENLIEQFAQGELPGITEKIVAQTGGSPLFVIALLQHMFEIGVLFVDTGGRWNFAGEQVLSLPPTICETIGARLRKLNRSQRRAFDLAAVLGGEFDFAVLQQASQEPEDLLLDILDALLDAGLLIEPRTIGRGEFALPHDCYAEVAYETLPDVRRRQLHRRVAQAIEQVYTSDLSPHYPVLAYHFGRAQEAERECCYARLAGEQAVTQFANAEAITHLSRALELTPDEAATREQRYELLRIREKVYDLQGDRQAQKADLATLESLVENMDDRQRAEVALRRATYAWETSDFPTACEVAQETIYLAQQCRAIEIEAASHLLFGKTLTGEEGRLHLETALALASSAGLDWMEGDILRGLGNVYYGDRDLVKANTCYEQSLLIHHQQGDRRGEIASLNNLGLAHKEQGDIDKANSQYEQALMICQQIGDRLAEGVLTFNLGSAALCQGDHTKARIWYEQSLATRREIDDREGQGVLLDWLGELARQQGHYTEARVNCQQALQIARQVNMQNHEGSALNHLGLILRDLGDYISAQDHFLQAHRLLGESGDASRILSNLGLLFHQQGDDHTAHEYCQQALEQAKVDIHAQALALTNLGYVHSGLGNLDTAGEAYQEALDLRRHMGQVHLATELLAGLSCLALDQGNTGQALAHTEEILSHLETKNLDGTDQPFLIYLTCYRVLRACQDPRAQEILNASHELLRARAATIEGDEMRRSFLENVNAHREITRAYTS
jgi:DNA-binding SARP family transcriptional activator/Tfp pilus assembly protein PilF